MVYGLIVNLAAFLAGGFFSLFLFFGWRGALIAGAAALLAAGFFEAARERLVREINNGWSDNDRAFLLGFKQGKPDWSLFPLENLPRMPAVQWKLLNIQKLIKQNPDKHAEQLKALEDRLSG